MGDKNVENPTVREQRLGLLGDEYFAYRAFRVFCAPPIVYEVARADNVRVGRAVTEVDFLINVPVLKTHRGTLLSNCVKNIGVGVACREEKKRLHRLGIDEGLLDVFSVVKPHFNVVDALVCIEGDGPNFPPGKPRTLGLVMAGEDGVAVDAVCARLIGLDPLEVKHLRLVERVRPARIVLKFLPGCARER